MDLIENSYGECLNIFKGHFFKVSDYIFFKIILLNNFFNVFEPVRLFKASIYRGRF